MRAVVQEYLDAARESLEQAPSDRSWPKALIVPHAGYMYSGAVAARAYAALEPGADRVERVILIGPSHHVRFDGIAVSASSAFETPLGRTPVDETSRRQVLSFPFVHALDAAHQWEHSLEVQLPFLQVVLRRFSLLPLAVGQATAAQVRAVLDACWGGNETLIVVSSDLSHYHDYETAKHMDTATAEAIESLMPERIGQDGACGRIGIQGILEAARERSLLPRTLDLRSSGDTAGGRDEVVGYGAWAFTAARNGSP